MDASNSAVPKTSSADTKTTFRSLKMELGIVLIIAFLVSVAFYVLLSTIMNALVQDHFGSEEFTQKHNKVLASRLSVFVEQKSVRSDDWYTLRRWAESNHLYQLTIYHDKVMIFRYDKNNESANYQKESSISSINSDNASNVPETEINEIGDTAYEIPFSDYKCNVTLISNYADNYYTISKVIALLLSVALFNLIFLYIASRKLQYLNELSQQIKTLAQGDFNTSIRIRGNDDLTAMAVGIDAMRLSFVQTLKQNLQMQEEQKDVITAMSHDMRTPMTPLLVYLQMLADHKYNDEEQHDQYISKSLEKALQLKALSDNMFSYLLLEKNNDDEMVTVSMKEAFYDQLSGMFDYLGANGFTIDADIDMQDVFIRVNMTYMYRIFDNLVSNIQKYADPEQYITVKLYCEYGKVVLRMRNSINYLADYSSSTGFGVKNIRKMISNMSAEFIESKKSDRYDTIMLFKIVEADDEEGISTDS